jgi:hypothetical protein
VPVSISSGSNSPPLAARSRWTRVIPHCLRWGCSFRDIRRRSYFGQIFWQVCEKARLQALCACRFAPPPRDSSGLQLKSGTRADTYVRCFCMEKTLTAARQVFSEPASQRAKSDCRHLQRVTQAVHLNWTVLSSGTRRPGFERLLRALCDGRVGAVFCIEASRLARNGRDWHTLIPPGNCI